MFLEISQNSQEITCTRVSFLIKLQAPPSKHFLFSKTSSRRFEDVFSVTLFVFQDVLKMSSRRLQDVFAIRFPKTSSRRLQDVFQDVFKTYVQDVLQLCLQDVLEDKKVLHWRRLQDVFKTSSVLLHQDECLLGCNFIKIETQAQVFSCEFLRNF